MESEYTFKQHAFLKDLGIGFENLGCYDGKKWCGSGKHMNSINPTSSGARSQIQIKF
jgi:hypothetical protein